MDTVTATNTVTAIPTSITMVMAMDMEEMKIKKFNIYYFVYKKTTADRWFFYGWYFFNFRKISLVEILELIPIASLAF